MKRLAGELTYYMIRPCKLICFLEKREKKKKKKGPTMGGGGGIWQCGDNRVTAHQFK